MDVGFGSHIQPLYVTPEMMTKSNSSGARTHFRYGFTSDNFSLVDSEADSLVLSVQRACGPEHHV